MGTIERKVISDESLTIYTTQGNISRDEVKDAVRDFYEKGPITKNVLWDVSHAVLKELSAEDVQQIAHVPRKSLDLRAGGKTAIVAPDDLAYGLSRMYQTSSHSEELPFQLQVFRNAENAMAWFNDSSPED